MPTIPIGTVIAGALYPLAYAGTPTDGTSETQTLTLANVTGGTFTITFDGYTTAAITWSATTNTLLSRINTALRALPNVGGTAWTATDVSLSGGNGDVLLTASGDLGVLELPLMVADDTSLTGTGAAASIAETTPGVTATFRTALTGALLIDTTTGNYYTNAGTPPAPTWTLLTSAALTVPQAGVAVLAATTDIDAVPGSFANLAAVQTYLAGANVVPNIEARLDALEAKINLLITTLVTAQVLS